MSAQTNWGAFRALRTFRALRPLRALSRFKGMKVTNGIRKLLIVFNIKLQYVTVSNIAKFHLLSEHNRNVGSVVEWLKCRTCDQHGLGSKPTRTILLCPSERNFTAIFSDWWSWQAVLNFSKIAIKLQANSKVVVSPEAGWGNCLLYLRCFPASQEINIEEK